MGAVLDFSAKLESMTCPSCGVEFAMPLHLVMARRGNKESFYCPNGHSMFFHGETDEAKIARLTKERDTAQAKVRAAEEAAKVERTKARKLRKRIAAGVCPCCQRTFTGSRLARHLKTKHPEWTGPDAARDPEGGETTP